MGTEHHRNHVYRMRPAKAGAERYVIRLMNQGREAEALAYMKAKGLVESFAGAPDSKPVSTPEIVQRPTASNVDEPLPQYRLARDVVPEGVRYARIHREMGNPLLKVAICEDTKEEVLLWIGHREQSMAKMRKGRLIGQVFTIQRNPDKLQGGWTLWRRLFNLTRAYRIHTGRNHDPEICHPIYRRR